MCIDKEYKIPKIIHYCWFGGNESSKKMKFCLETWKKFLPDYEIKEWNDENIKEISSPYLDVARDNKMLAFMSDYVRFWALYNYGGIYLDTDVEVLKSFDSLLSNDFFVGLELCTSYPSIGTATIGAIKNLELVKDILNMYDNHNPIRENGHFDYFSTSPKLLVNFIKEKYGYDFKKMSFNYQVTEFLPNCKVFPEDYFSAHKSGKTENSYCKHLFAGNWGIAWKIKTPINLKNLKIHVLKKTHYQNNSLPLLDNEELLFYLKLNKKKSIALVSVK